ncbi:MAG: hypothetical protein WA081_19320 [Desulfosalsimonadaceae bacterium]
MKKHIWPVLILFLVLFQASMAAAHRVVVFGWIEGDTVYTESQYPDGKRVKNGQILVYDADGKELLTGTTSENGEFSFKIPKSSALRIVIQAGMGHQGEWKFSAQEIQAAAGGAGSPAQPPGPDPVPDKPLPATDAPVAAPQPDPKQLERMMERLLDKKLHPITRMLVEMQQKGPTVTDIFGGIGYIVGLMGMAAYFLSKKNNGKQ